VVPAFHSSVPWLSFRLLKGFPSIHLPPYQLPWSQESHFCLRITSDLGVVTEIQSGMDALFDLYSLTSDIFYSFSYPCAGLVIFPRQWHPAHGHIDRLGHIPQIPAHQPPLARDELHPGCSLYLPFHCSVFCILRFAPEKGAWHWLCDYSMKERFSRTSICAKVLFSFMFCYIWGSGCFVFFSSTQSL